MKVIFDLLGEALFNKNADITNVNVDDIFREASIQEVSPIIYGVLKKKNVFNSENEEQWKKSLNKRIAKGNGIFITHAIISNIFQDIEHTTIKGVASAKYYSEPFARIMGDVDVIVKDLEKAKEILINRGFEFKPIGEGLWHIEFKKRNVSVELHHRIHGIPDNNEEIEKLFFDLYEKAEKYPTVFGDITVPSDFHHGLILLLHMHGHLNSSGIGLRHLCDWAVFVNKFSEEEFADIFEHKLKNIGLWRFARIISQACTVIGLDYKNWMGEREEDFLEFIISDVVASGNFGRKSEERNTVLSFVPKDIENKSTPALQYLKHGIKSIYSMWPTVKKHKILLPFAFIVYCFRILFRLFKGESKLYNLKEGYERREVFKELKCFIKEEE